MYKQFFHPPDPQNYTSLLGQGTVVPCQIEAYFLALNHYLREKETVLDVGFGLGYGLNIMAIKASEVSGVDIDPRALDYCQKTGLYQDHAASNKDRQYTIRLIAYTTRQHCTQLIQDS